MTNPSPPRKLRAYLELVRLPAVFTAPSDILLGLAIVTALGEHSWPVAHGALLVLCGALVYCAGMATNDLFDSDVDAEERPGRPIPSGRIRTSEAWLFALTLQGAALIAGAAVGQTSLMAIAATILMTYVYNGLTKAHWSGPLFMGLCRYCNALIGLSILGWPDGCFGYMFPLGVVLYVIGVTLCSRGEVEGAQVDSLKWGIVVLLFGSLTPLVWLGLNGPAYESFALCALVLAGWLAVKAGPLTSGGRPEAVRGLVMRGIKGIACLNAILAAMVGGWVEALIVLCLLVPGYFFGRWFYST